MVLGLFYLFALAYENCLLDLELKTLQQEARLHIAIQNNCQHQILWLSGEMEEFLWISLEA